MTKPVESVTTMKRFGEVYEKAFDNAEMRRFRDIVGKEMVITDYVERWGRNGKMFVVLAQDAETQQRFTIIIYNQNIQRKIARAKSQEMLPLIGKIYDNEGYFDIM